MAWDEAQAAGRSTIETIDLILAILQETAGIPVKVLRSLGAEPSEFVSRLVAHVRSREVRQEEIRKKFELSPHLKPFGVNLNLLAHQGKLPLIVGRDREIEQMMEILCHKERANSVMLIGDTGVGKTAVVEGLARKLEMEPHTVPRRLRNCQIVNVQMNTIVAGTILRGMFEERIQNIINELREKHHLILFVDEAHTLIGAGSALGVPSDAANIFKSALARGEIRIIGATTATEYKSIMAEDEALARRFRVVTVTEPTVDDTRKILFGIRPRLEQNYHVQLTDEAIESALEMSRRYQRSLKMPDKPIAWLHTACVKTEIHHPDSPVTPEDVVRVISQETGIPQDMVVRDTIDRFQDLEGILHRRVVGQHEAVEAVARRLRLNKGPLKENFARPDGVLLFLGPTGVGKTETAKALAEFLFGDDNRMVRIDMSEYQDSIGVDKLIGMPRGIVGSEMGGLLTNQLRDNPYTVALLDEIEKAHPFVFHLFLQVFDEGWLTDGRGRKVYFSDAVVIMTSNLGHEQFKRLTVPMGFLTDAQSFPTIKQAVLKESERTFQPEFLNRIDEIIVFAPLTRDEVREIGRRYLGKIQQYMQEQGKELELTEGALEILIRVGYSLKYGARFLKRTIDDQVKIPVTIHWKEGTRFVADVENDAVRVRWE
ncbi:MAG: ATP-dependent Clp protease ATP-binding subunit [Deltaproteobacteria bacterium]|nr:ATP-dependent Clp protease ATP-binding subunit [Deltaproteobacteria bacterium]